MRRATSAARYRARLTRSLPVWVMRCPQRSQPPELELSGNMPQKPRNCRSLVKRCTLAIEPTNTGARAAPKPGMDCMALLG